MPVRYFVKLFKLFCIIENDDSELFSVKPVFGKCPGKFGEYIIRKLLVAFKHFMIQRITVNTQCAESSQLIQCGGLAACASARKTDNNRYYFS